MTLIIAWFSTAIAFGIADAIWLSQVGPRLYRPLIGELLAPAVNWPAAIVFYAIYVSGLVYFAVAPALEKQSLAAAVINGAVMGFIAYATYDLTNHATMKVWDLKVTLFDMAWGTFASGLAAGVAYWVTQRFA